MSEDDSTKAASSIFSKLQDMDNKLEKIKSDTHNLNRIASLRDSDLIKKEIMKVIGKSEIRAAILDNTKEPISATDLAKVVGIDPKLLSRDLSLFTGNKGLITVTEVGTKRFYQRAELVNLVGIDEHEPYVLLIGQWERRRIQPVADQPGPAPVNP